MEGLGKLQPLEKEKQMNEYIITGLSGNQYQPMDTAPIPHTPTIKELFNTLATTMQQLGSLIESHYHQSSQDSLVEAVDTALENADWLYAKLSDSVDKRYDIEDMVKESMRDLIEHGVDEHFRNQFNLEDYVDVRDALDDIVCDRIEDAVKEAIEDLLEDAVDKALKTASVRIEF